MDIICMPEGVNTVLIPVSPPVARSLTPNMRGTEGPVISASIMPTDFPCLWANEASREVVSDFPTPPFPLTTAIAFLMEASACGDLRKLSFVLDEQFDEHDEQSCVQFSDITFLLAFSFFRLDIILFFIAFVNAKAGPTESKSRVQAVIKPFFRQKLFVIAAFGDTFVGNI